MSKVKKDKIEAKGFAIQIYTEDFRNDYISLTDIARYKNMHEPKDIVKNWLRVRNTIEFLGLWKIIPNPNFKGGEFDSFRKLARTQLTSLEKLNNSGIKKLEGKNLSKTFNNVDEMFEELDK